MKPSNGFLMRRFFLLDFNCAKNPVQSIFWRITNLIKQNYVTERTAFNFSLQFFLFHIKNKYLFFVSGLRWTKNKQTKQWYTFTIEVCVSFVCTKKFYFKSHQNIKFHFIICAQSLTKIVVYSAYDYQHT